MGSSLTQFKHEILYFLIKTTPIQSPYSEYLENRIKYIKFGCIDQTFLLYFDRKKIKPYKQSNKIKNKLSQIMVLGKFQDSTKTR